MEFFKEHYESCLLCCTWSPERKWLRGEDQYFYLYVRNEVLLGLCIARLVLFCFVLELYSNTYFVCVPKMKLEKSLDLCTAT